MITFGYDDETQTLYFMNGNDKFREITPYPDKEGALEWAQMLADIDNAPIIKDIDNGVAQVDG